MKPEEQLVWKLIDRDISKSDFHKLQESFLKSKDLRKYYQDCLETHAVLSSYTKPEGNPIPFPSDQQEKKPRPPAWLGWAAAVLVFAYFGLAPATPSQVAISSAEHPEWRGTQLTRGDTVPHRLLYLKKGNISLKFPSNTSAHIQGPACFQVIDDQTLEVMEGKLDIAHQGKPRSFTLLTPVGKLTDLGTRFEVVIKNLEQQTKIHTKVIEGKVEFTSENQNKTKILSEGDRFILTGTHRGAPVIIEEWTDPDTSTDTINAQSPPGNITPNRHLKKPTFSAIDLMLEGNLKAQIKYSMIDAIAQSIDEKAQVLIDAEKAFSIGQNVSFAEAAMPEIEAMAHAIVEGCIDFSKLSFWSTCQTAEITWFEHKDKSGKVSHRVPHVQHLKDPAEGNRMLVNLERIKSWLESVHLIHEEKGLGWVSSFGCPEDGKLIYLRRENDIAALSNTIASIKQNLE
ncbi:MAG: hypothetical protein P8N49_07760 [Opitutales bacterium]|nr:hypothetical protein [Opitutales bacterium]